MRGNLPHQEGGHVLSEQEVQFPYMCCQEKPPVAEPISNISHKLRTSVSTLAFVYTSFFYQLHNLFQTFSEREDFAQRLSCCLLLQQRAAQVVVFAPLKLTNSKAPRLPLSGHALRC